MSGLAVVDISPLFAADENRRRNAAMAIGDAARTDGFFYVSGHGVEAETISRLDAKARAFFALSEAEKSEIAMARGGAAWRGWFPLGGELTSGAPDRKEGIYFGEELAAEDERVRSGWPMHGANLWPLRPPELRAAVEAYVSQTTRAAQAVMKGVSLTLGLDADHFETTYLCRPTVLFRIFRYPPVQAEGWGVAEHTDYGLLTLLAQDACGGLQVRGERGWIDAPPLAGTLVCNVGDMLERLSGGRFVSAPHRVRNDAGSDRLSFPLFYDPDFTAMMTPALEPVDAAHRLRSRWDNADPNLFAGRYGDYLLRKVGAVFPALKAEAAVQGRADFYSY
jgi:isopenicillin N synthase-like dioxygenase